MHRTNYLLALAAAGSLATTVAPAPAVYAQEPQQSGRISGRVTTRRGTPLPAAHIDVTDHNTGQTIATLTRDDGQYAVSGLALGHAYECARPEHRLRSTPAVRVSARRRGGRRLG